MASKFRASFCKWYCQESKVWCYQGDYIGPSWFQSSSQQDQLENSHRQDTFAKTPESKCEAGPQRSRR